jgi:hypothetical protein
MKRLALRLVLLLLLPPGVRAQVPSTGADTVVVIAGAQYEASGWWRLWWGDHYREAWTTPMKAEVLDCGQFTGGVTPVGVGGGRQTRTLRLQGSDGRAYFFRSLDKDPSEVLPPVLRTSIAGDVLRDQISSQHPLGEIMVSALASAAGVPHPDPKLVVFADEPGLGEFRDEFRGLPGLIEEAADEGLSDLAAMGPPVEVVGSKTLMQRLQGSCADRVDSHAFLRARLLDFYVGDWDRHPAQWRWAAYDEGSARLWYPIPLDRDQAFSRLDGVFPSLAQRMVPSVTGFDRGYDALSLHWNARFVDRRFLVDLERAAFDSAAASLRMAFTDEVVEEALGRLPPELYALDVEWLGDNLRARRETLLEAAGRYYLLLAREVDVHATNEPEEVLVNGGEDGSVEVVVRPLSRPDEPYFRRRFELSETKEVRLYLYGGDDRVAIRGGDSFAMKVRVIGGAGEDVVHFETDTRGVIVYDVDGDTRVTGERSERVNTAFYKDPPDVPDPMEPPPRDWGRWSMPQVTLGLSSDYGFKLGAGNAWYDYGFRKKPYASKIGLSGAVSTALKFDARLTSDFRFENSRAFMMGQLFANSFDVLHFYGFGNDAPAVSRDSAKVDRTVAALELAVGSFPGTSTSFAIGPVISYSQTGANEGRLIGEIPDLYGGGDFWQTGAFARFDWDSRRNIRIKWTGEVPDLTGAALTAQGRAYPAWVDAVEAYGWLSGELRGYLELPLFKEATHGAARIGGKKIWGAFPWYDAAFIGGPQSVRGWVASRFAGDASAYASAELRIHLLDGHFLMPSMWGLLGFADVGRVWVGGESPGGEHWGFGGGLWWGLLGTKNIVSLEVGVSEEDTTLYFEWAFAY